MPDTVLHAISFYPSYNPTEDYGPHCYRLRNWISEVKGTKIINGEWQSHNSKPGEYNLCALLYIRVAASNPLWKNSEYK